MKHLPKILPWIAKKNSISEELTAKLWRRASGEIAGLLGNTETPELHKRTLERFLDLVEAESANLVVPAANLAQFAMASSPADFAWMLRHQSRMTFLSLLAVENASQVMQNSWANVFRPQGGYVAQHL